MDNDVDDVVDEDDDSDHTVVQLRVFLLLSHPFGRIIYHTISPVDQRRTETCSCYSLMSRGSINSPPK